MNPFMVKHMQTALELQKMQAKLDTFDEKLAEKSDAKKSLLSQINSCNFEFNANQSGLTILASQYAWLNSLKQDVSNIEREISVLADQREHLLSQYIFAQTKNEHVQAKIDDLAAQTRKALLRTQTKRQELANTDYFMRQK